MREDVIRLDHGRSLSIGDGEIVGGLRRVPRRRREDALCEVISAKSRLSFFFLFFFFPQNVGAGSGASSRFERLTTWWRWSGGIIGSRESWGREHSSPRAHNNAQQPFSAGEVSEAIVAKSIVERKIVSPRSKEAENGEDALMDRFVVVARPACQVRQCGVGGGLSRSDFAGSFRLCV